MYTVYFYFVVDLFIYFYCMKILIVSATKFEIAPFLESLRAPEIRSNQHTSYRTNHHQVDILITGVGMVFTTYYVSTLLAATKYDYALNAGVAGAIDKKIKLGEIVNVVDDYFYELGAEDGDAWLNVADLNLLTENDFPYSSNGLVNANLPNMKLIKELRQVKGQTVNKVHGNAQSIKIMESRSNAQIESMEGAAFLYCCLQHNLPSAQIRAISNYVEPRNKATWQMKEALLNLNEFLNRLIIT
jgi:futalosine hydrolase